ncbi:hypothetical protein M407DRAFT_228697 [Tulasnella calospora MUT 4182]|uniref:Vacuolar protein sorting-associated protein 62 n=1 Tax=Tulasnella calospora MUT 4182 TaxID=1051891 RepID=A0A0C3M5W1_9AGAM|nr:hypothetical protein M407DRAFT_228697 [Tulasnella calospora MUT 4182]
MSDPQTKVEESTSLPNKVEDVAKNAVEKAVEAAVKEAPSVPPSADKTGLATILGAAKAVEAGLAAQRGTDPNYEALPAFALKYAPLMWLNSGEQYWPGNPLEFLENTKPQHKTGAPVDVPPDLLGKPESLKLPAVNDPDVYLTFNEDPRTNSHIEKLISLPGKPDPTTHLSGSTCWIIVADKSHIVEPGVVDVFYFFFYPYNLGTFVVYTNFGNHVGDWEHSMIRFKDGKPIAIHLSAHSEGHSFSWDIMEKMGDRPVGYVARGSHANYAKPGDKAYSKVPIFGPVDHADKGLLWDPSLKYVAAKFDPPTGTFTPMKAPHPTTTTTAAPPTPGAAPTPAGASSAPPASTPVYDTSITPEDIVLVLNFQGKWGNSFSDIRFPKGSLGDKFTEFGDKLKNIFHIGKKQESGLQQDEKKKSVGLIQKLSMLRWSEGPTGPRYKSLERAGAQWNTTALSAQLV